MPIWLLIVLGVVAMLLCGFVLLVMTAVTRLIKAMDSDEFQVRQVELNELPNDGEWLVKYDAWANANSFEWQAAFRVSISDVGGTYLALWDRADHQSLVVVKGDGEAYPAFGVDFEGGDHRSVVTSASIESLTMPPFPGEYKQAFLGASLNELLELHEMACKRLTTELGWQIAARPADLADHFLNETREQAQYIRTLPLWPLWTTIYSLTRGARANKPIRVRNEHKVDRTTA